MSKTVEEAFEEWWQESIALFYAERDRALLKAKEYDGKKAAFTAGAAHGAAGGAGAY